MGSSLWGSIIWTTLEMQKRRGGGGGGRGGGGITIEKKASVGGGGQVVPIGWDKRGGNLRQPVERH